MTDLPARKAELRALALARRTEIDPSLHEELSRRAADRIRPFLPPGGTVSLFWPMKGEISPLSLFEGIRAAGGAIALPRVNKREMTFRRFADGDALEHGPFGTRHPAAADEIDPDLIVAPLAAFDRTGGRIGYGAGYYDLAIARLRDKGRLPRAVGIAFACQEVDRVPTEPHDQPLFAIATEDELIETGEPA